MVQRETIPFERSYARAKRTAAARKSKPKRADRLLRGVARSGGAIARGSGGSLRLGFLLGSVSL